MQNNYNHEQWSPYPQYPAQPTPYQPIRKPGSIDVLAAIKYGFSAVFERPLAWIGGHALAGAAFLLATGMIVVATILLGVVRQPDEPGIVAVAVIVAFALVPSVAIPPVFYILALLHIDQLPFNFQNFKERGNYWDSVVAVFLSSLLIILLELPVNFAERVVEKGLVSDPTAYLLTLFILVGYLASLVLYATLIFTGFFPIDTDKRGFEAVKASFKLSKKSFWSVLALAISLYIINIVGFLMCGIGLLITLPASTLAVAHAYRQATDRLPTLGWGGYSGVRM